MSYKNKLFSSKSAIPKITSFLSPGLSDSELMLSEIYGGQIFLGFDWVRFFCFASSVCNRINRNC